MTKVKTFFKIEKKFKLEYNDIRALLTLFNVILIMTYGFNIALFGLVVSLLGFMKDLFIDRHINGFVMHLSNIILNSYFLILYYGG